jgi:hypothetical protein
MSEGALTGFGVTPRPQSNQNSASAILRLVLYKGEVYRLPPACRSVQVLAGLAWVTVVGKDVILAQGQKASLISSQDGVLISTLGHLPLVLEIY